MALMSVDNGDNAVDNVLQRQGFGTLGGDHMVPSSVGGNHLSNVITPLDAGTQYFKAPSGGGWTAQDGINAYNFLSYATFCSSPGAFMRLTFTGSKLAIIGSTFSQGGRMDVYIDGALATGALNTSTALSLAYYTTGGLNASDTTISVLDTTNFATTGSILIDAEEITYTGISGSSFTGCTRGANGTKAAIHTAGNTIYSIGTNVDFYSPFSQDRIILWRKNNMTAGNHVLQLVVRSDHNSSSSGFEVSLGGFILGGIMGASNVLTSLRYIDLQGVLTDANGVAGPYLISPFDTDSQLLGITGVAPVSGCNWCFPMYNPAADELQIVCDTKSGSGIHVVLSALYLGPSL